MSIERRPAQPDEGQQPFGGEKNAPQREEHPIHGPPEWVGRDRPARERDPGDSQFIWTLVRHELAARSIPVEQFRRELGISRQTLRNYQAGAINRISNRILRQICGYFGWSDPVQIRMHGPRFRAEVQALERRVRSSHDSGPDDRGVRPFDPLSDWLDGLEDVEEWAERLANDELANHSIEDDG
jgi:DNA-binding Xre family transcriptional regulator